MSHPLWPRLILGVESNCCRSSSSARSRSRSWCSWSDAHDERPSSLSCAIRASCLMLDERPSASFRAREERYAFVARRWGRSGKKSRPMIRDRVSVYSSSCLLANQCDPTAVGEGAHVKHLLLIQRALARVRRGALNQARRGARPGAEVVGHCVLFARGPLLVRKVLL